MRKMYLILLIALGTSGGLAAQSASLTPTVIASAGDWQKPSPLGASLSSTIGETVEEYFHPNVGEAGLSQGFQQSDLTSTLITAVSDPMATWSMEVFPVPTQGILNVRVLNHPEPDFELSLTDITGKTVMTSQLTSDRGQLNLNNVSSGTYHLRVIETATNSSQLYKIVKTN